MNILVLTSVYPYTTSESQNVTKVVKYFAEEWARQGHNVIVIHNAHRYMRFIHDLPHFIKNKIASRIDFYIPDFKDVKEYREKSNDVLVYRLPILKLIPHGGHSQAVLARQTEKIENILRDNSFIPDVIVGHWMSPQIQIISRLKNSYSCKTALVLHGRDYVEGKRFDYSKYINMVDRIGCRSQSDVKYLADHMKLSAPPFVCYSGIPDKYISADAVADKFTMPVDEWKIVFVGRLVKYKNVDKTIIALSKFQNLNYTFEIIGDGAEKQPLMKLAEELGISGKVMFSGQLSRDEVRNHLERSHCFIMVSDGEVFGLAYLEAMASGCITVATKNGGVDGIVVNAENGYLCDSGDVNQLYNLIKIIVNLPLQDIKSISQSGFNTAKEFTDSKVAENYLNIIT